ncbi:MAG: TIGR00296 family protein [Candidatus Methanomethylophilaceae archaeon]|nr:TIGR00296 family protein [Candidatus Methanomethylophilaceae archaeon]
MIDDGCGFRAVRAARETVLSETSGESSTVPRDGEFAKERGVFVTLSTYPDHGLRGCIGIPMPVLPLGEALEEAARSACHDPRFPDLRPEELAHVTVEVTVMTVPQRMPYPKQELPGRIGIGRHGLIITCGRRRGLLLPQVPVEWGWGPEEFLEHLSLKAGLPPDAWKRDDAVIESFEGEIFRETSPGGEIVRG